MDNFARNLEAYALLSGVSMSDLENAIPDYYLKIKCPDLFTLTDLRHIIGMLDVRLEELCSNVCQNVCQKRSCNILLSLRTGARGGI
jgi:hypothetical protein